MAITTLDGYIASAKQNITWTRNGVLTTVAAMPYTFLNLLGTPGGAADLNVGNTANGIVPTDALPGHPTINAFGGGATGYISRIMWGSTVACTMRLYDCVFACGSYAYNAGTTTLTSIPSYATRIPSLDYTGLEIWAENSTLAVTASAHVVTYTNESGATGHTTGTVTGGGLIANRMTPLPLAAGDKGVMALETVTPSTATGGTFNYRVMRPLWQGRVPIIGGGDQANLLDTGLIQIYDTSALYVVMHTDSTAAGVPWMQIEICNG